MEKQIKIQPADEMATEPPHTKTAVSSAPQAGNTAAMPSSSTDSPKPKPFDVVSSSDAQAANEARRIKLTESKIANILAGNQTNERKSKIITSVFGKLTKTHRESLRKIDTLEKQILALAKMQDAANSQNADADAKVTELNAKLAQTQAQLDEALKSIEAGRTELQTTQLSLKETSAERDLLRSKLKAAERMLRERPAQKESDGRKSIAELLDAEFKAQALEGIRSIGALKNVIDYQVQELEFISNIYSGIEAKITRHSEKLGQKLNVDDDVD